MKLSCIPQTHILLYLNQPLRCRYLYFNKNLMVLEAHALYMQWETELLCLCVYMQQGCSYHTARVCKAWGPTSLSQQIIVFTQTEHCPLSGKILFYLPDLSFVWTCFNIANYFLYTNILLLAHNYEGIKKKLMLGGDCNKKQTTIRKSPKISNTWSNYYRRLTIWNCFICKPSPLIIVLWDMDMYLSGMTGPICKLCKGAQKS